MELLKYTKKWDKKIDITLTLAELQELYCAFGATSFSDRQKAWGDIFVDNGKEIENCPFKNNNGLYDDLENILKECGGDING